MVYILSESIIRPANNIGDHQLSAHERPSLGVTLTVHVKEDILDVRDFLRGDHGGRNQKNEALFLAYDIYLITGK